MLYQFTTARPSLRGGCTPAPMLFRGPDEAIPLAVEEIASGGYALAMTAVLRKVNS